MLTVALVVMVIFLFLRNLWATIIPAITVPLSLVGTFAVLYVLGYSLDNLSLMALTIAVGFVVDDAVVVIENIVRHLEEGATPLQAALQGAGEIGFTILSMTLSLIAVFIPLFLMSGYVGLLFREFAVTVSVALVLSLVISLTLTPMMCARLLRNARPGQHGWLYRVLERGFRRSARPLRARPQGGASPQLHHLDGDAGHDGADRLPLCHHSQGLLSAAGHGNDPGHRRGLRRTSPSRRWPSASQAVIGVVSQDPAVASVGSQIGAGGATATLNDGRMFIALKPESQRSASADQVINRLRPKLAKIQGITLYMQAAQDITIGARLSKTQYQFTLADADRGRAESLGRAVPRQDSEACPASPT